MHVTPVHTSVHHHSFQSFLPLPLTLVGAVLFAIFIGFTSKPVADFLYYHIVRVDDPALNALEFSVYPLLIAFAITLRRLAAYGLHPGSTLRQWKLVLVSLLIVGEYVLLGNRTSWDSRSAVNFTVVPLYEELLFRGVLFTLLLAYGQRHYSGA